MLIVGLLVSGLICKKSLELGSHHIHSFKEKLNKLTQRRNEVVIEIASQITALKSEEKGKSSHR